LKGWIHKNEYEPIVETVTDAIEVQEQSVD